MTVTGFINVNKPVGLTSHDVVVQVRRHLKIAKVGHAGTLDPLADGVLVVCLGSATRLSEYVMQADKTYRARVRLGIATDTYDAEGQVTAVQPAEHVQRDDVEQALRAFEGDVLQTPPAFSAIKQGGRKLYERARAGEVVVPPLRPVRIVSLHIQDWSPPELTIEVVCSAGTYIRSLAHDLGQALGVGAHLASLTRMASGRFALADAVDLKTLLADTDWPKRVISPRAALADWPSLQLTHDQVARVRHGQRLSLELADVGRTVLAYTEDGALAAVLRFQDGWWHPDKVFLEGAG